MRRVTVRTDPGEHVAATSGIVSGATLRLRDDLIRRRIWLADRHVWVWKNPRDDSFYFFEPDEDAILRTLERPASRDEFLVDCLGRFSELGLTPDTLSAFLDDALANGLIEVSPGSAETVKRTTARPRTRPPWWRNPLAIRLPGVDPAPLLDRLTPIANSLMHRSMAVIAVLLIVSAVLIGLLHMEAFLADLTSATLRLTSSAATARGSFSSTVAGLASAVVIAKVFHELAHALVCHVNGGRCREMGVMLLLGVPCLYCDISDAWLMPTRRQRILTSAAGMMAESIVAAVAMLIWAVTLPGSLHDLATLLVVVCSISTLVFNGNPLMRYDGYFMLSDWLGIPNLAGESASAMLRRCRAWLWGLSPWKPMPGDPPQGRLIVYGVLSLAYRVLVICVIVGIGMKLARDAGLVWIAVLVSGFLVVGLLRRVVAALYRRPDRALASTAGIWTRSVAVAVGLLLILLIPLPRSLRVGGMIVPVDETELVLPVGGAVLGGLPAGSLVRSGDVILRVQDWDHAFRLDSSLADIRRLRQTLRAVRIERIGDASVASELPEIRGRLATAERQYETLSAARHRQTVRASRGGKIFQAEPRTITAEQLAHDQRNWTGSPLQPANVGATLDSGTTIGYLGDPVKREIRLLVPQNRIESVESGQQVELHLSGLPRRLRLGTVTSVSSRPVGDLPPALVADGWASTRLPLDGSAASDSVDYEVIAALANDAEVEPLRVGTVTGATIRLSRSSLLDRLWRILDDHFVW